MNTKHKLATTLALGAALDASALELLARKVVPFNPVQNTTVVIPPGRRTINPQTERVYLTTGENFTGKLLGFTPGKSLRWSHPHVSGEMNIKADGVRRLTLAAGVAAQARRHDCVVKFTNGDEIAGDLLGMDNGKLQLNTWYGGKLAIDMTTVKSITPGKPASTGKVAYAGPAANGNDWTRTSGSWGFKEGVFTSSSSGSMLGKMIDNFPKRASLDFEVDWATSMSMYVNFRTDQLNSYSSCNAYCLKLTNTRVYLYRYTRNQGGRNVGVRVNMSMGSSRNAKISIKIDEERNITALYINGKYVAQWKDVGGFAGKGKGVLFYSRTSSQMNFSNITVSEWDGTLPRQNLSVNVKGKEDFVQFGNGDSLTGQLRAIQNGELKMKSALGEFAIELGKVASIHNARAKGAPEMPKGSVRVTLAGRGQLTFQLLDWKNGELSVQSPSFGKATLNAKAVQAIDFQPAPIKTSSVKPPAPTPTGNLPFVNGAFRGKNADLELKIEPQILRGIRRR